VPQHLDPAEVLTALAHIMQTLQDIDRRLSALEAPTPPPYKCRVFFMLRWAAVVVLRPARLA